MAADEMAEFYVHTVSVENLLGKNSNGDVFAPAVTLAPPNGVFADGSRKLVRNKDGEQVVSESTLYTHTRNAALFSPGSRVTIVNDLDPRPAFVIRANLNDSGDMDLPDHIVVTLT